MARPRGATGCSVASAAMAKRKGRLSLAEKSTIQGVANGPLSVEKAAQHLAPTLGRSEEAMVKAIREAREELQSQASDYVKLHRKAAEKAAEQGNSKPAEWMLERIEAGGERIVQPAKAEQSSGIKIILANVRMGGTRRTESDIEVVDAGIANAIPE